jgi:hypothetical protein
MCTVGDCLCCCQGSAVAAAAGPAPGA